MSFVAAGAYGCVFRPPLPCVDDGGTTTTTDRRPTVGKVFADADEFERERDALRVVRRMDPDGAFAIPWVRDCVANVRHAGAASCSRLLLLLRTHTHT